MNKKHKHKRIDFYISGFSIDDAIKELHDVKKRIMDNHKNVSDMRVELGVEYDYDNADPKLEITFNYDE